MKKSVGLIQIFLIVLIVGCGDKNKDVDARETYLDVKINGNWVDFSKDMGAGFGQRAYPFSGYEGAFSGSDGTNEIHFQFDITNIRYAVFGSDTTTITPYNKYRLHGFYFKENGQQTIACGTVSLNPVGSCSFGELSITNDNNNIFEGRVVVSSSANQLNITDCRFRIKPNTPIPFKK